MAHARMCVTVSLFIGDLGYLKTEHFERVAVSAVSGTDRVFRFPGTASRAPSTGTERELS